MDDAYNQRQLYFMLEIIDNYMHKKISLNKLISDLEALYDLVQLNDRNWKEHFRSEWWELEQINAVQIYRKSIDVKDDLDIKIALDNLKKIINEKVMDRHEEKQQIGLGESDQQKI